MRTQTYKKLILNLTFLWALFLLCLACGSGGGISGTGDGLAGTGGGISGTGDGTTSVTNAGVSDISDSTSTTNYLINGPIESINLLTGNITLFGRDVITDANTKYTDSSSTALTDLAMKDLSVGDSISTTLMKSSDNLTVLTLTRTDSTKVWTLRGSATSSSTGSLTLENINVLTTSSSNFMDDAGTTMTEAGFYAVLTSDNIIEATGTGTSTPLNADSVEYK